MITVFTSCHNQEKYLAKAIHSVLTQTEKDFEYRIYDDGSTDGTWDIIQTYAKKDKRIIAKKLEKTDNVGVVAKMCMEEMKGKVWTWCPSDDIWLPTLLETKKKFSENHPNCILYSDWIVIDQNGKELMEKHPRLSPKEFSEEIWTGCPIGFTGIWIPKTVIDRVGPFPTHLKYSEDFYWMLKANVHKIPFVGVRKTLYKKRKHTNTLTHKNLQSILDQIPVLVSDIRTYQSTLQESVEDSFGLTDWWRFHHSHEDTQYLTGSDPEYVWNCLNIKDKIKKSRSILDIGVGSGSEVKALSRLGKEVSCLDTCPEAISKVSDFIEFGYIFGECKLPENCFDLAISHLVAQHMSDTNLKRQLREVVQSLSSDGVLAIQIANSIQNQQGEVDWKKNQSLLNQKKGGVLRTIEQFEELIKEFGEIVWVSDPKYLGESGNIIFHYLHIRKKQNAA